MSSASTCFANEENNGADCLIEMSYTQSDALIKCTVVGKGHTCRSDKRRLLAQNPLGPPPPGCMRLKGVIPIIPLRRVVFLFFAFLFWVGVITRPGTVRVARGTVLFAKGGNHTISSSNIDFQHPHSLQTSFRSHLDSDILLDNLPLDRLTPSSTTTTDNSLFGRLRRT